MNVGNKDQDVLSSNKSSSKGRTKNKKLGDGIVGIKNNNLYCYMNACLQCLLPIKELRDYYLNQDYIRFQNQKCVSNSLDYCTMMAQFF